MVPPVKIEVGEDRPAPWPGAVAEEAPQSTLARLLAWAAVTIILVMAVMIASRSERATQRLAEVFVPQRPIQVQAPPAVASDTLLLYETRRLADAVRILSAERDHLADRLAAVERSVGDVTASIPPRDATRDVAREPAQTAARPTVRTAEPAPVVAAPPPAAQESVAVRTEFGVEIATEVSIEALRARWQQLRAQHGPLLEGLRPVVTVTDGARPGTVDLKLVAGPLGNANAASRLCVSLGAAGVNCKPSVFDGQRLAMR